MKTISLTEKIEKLPRNCQILLNNTSEPVERFRLKASEVSRAQRCSDLLSSIQRRNNLNTTTDHGKWWNEVPVKMSRTRAQSYLTSNDLT